MTKKLKQMGFVHLHLIIVAVLTIAAIGAIGSYVLHKSKAAGLTPSVSSFKVSSTQYTFGVSWISSYVTTSGYWRLALVSSTSGSMYGTVSTITHNSTKYTGLIELIQNTQIPNGDSYKVQLSYCSSSKSCATLATSAQAYSVNNPGTYTPTPIPTPSGSPGSSDNTFDMTNDNEVIISGQIIFDVDDGSNTSYSVQYPKTVRLYPVSGTTGKTLKKSLKALRSQPCNKNDYEWHGCTRVYFNEHSIHVVQVYADSTGTKCKFKSVRVSVPITVDLPSWVDHDNANTSQRLRTYWDSDFYLKVVSHENGHVDIDRKHIANIDTRLRNLTGPCSTFQTSALKIVNEEVTAMNTENSQYEPLHPVNWSYTD